MKKGPPRAPPNGGDYSISKRGRQAQKEKKVLGQGSDLARFLNRAKLADLARKMSGSLGTVPVRQVLCQAVWKGGRMHFSATIVHFSGTWHGFSTLYTPITGILIGFPSLRYVNDIHWAFAVFLVFFGGR